MKMYQEEFRKPLRDCAKTAKEAYKISNRRAVDLERVLSTLNDNLQGVLSESDLAPDISHKLNDFQSKVKDAIMHSKNELKDDLQKKYQKIKEFTVSLFGRTKAGKSTIREALTHGDGSTMGKGGQRTTRDLKEYMWEGLRIIDTPGLEAYQGEEDAREARGVIDQSDIVLFLTSDDSVQPGEFEEMARLTEIDKYFIVLLNVKENIRHPKRLKNFLANPNRLFDPTRIGQHDNRIRKYVKEHLKIKGLDVIPIHALAAFLSTTKEDKERSVGLWQLSKIGDLQEKIIQEVNQRGRHHRVLTFFNGTLNHMDTVQKMLAEICQQVECLVEFYTKKEKSLVSKLAWFNEDSLKKIRDRIRDVFGHIKNDIPGFIDNYIGKPNAQEEFRKLIDKKKIQGELDALVEEINSDLRIVLEEFDRESEYEASSFQFGESPDISKIKKGQTEKILKWTGVGIGSLGSIFFTMALFSAVNFWNPAGWAVMGVGAVLGIVAWFFKWREKKKWEEKKKEAKEKCLHHVDSMCDKLTRKLTEGWFEKKIINGSQEECLNQFGDYIRALNQIEGYIQNACKELNKLKMRMDKDRFVRLFQFEGICCNPAGIRSITHREDSKIQIELSLDCEDKLLKPAERNLSDLLGKQIHIKT